MHEYLLYKPYPDLQLHSADSGVLQCAPAIRVHALVSNIGRIIKAHATPDYIRMALLTKLINHKLTKSGVWFASKGFGGTIE